MEKAHIWQKIREETKEEKKGPTVKILEEQKELLGQYLNISIANVNVTGSIPPKQIKEIAGLINAGADLNSDYSGYPTIDYALDLQMLYPQLIQLLLNKGANVNYRNKKGQNPLNYYLDRATMDNLVGVPYIKFKAPRPDISVVRTLIEHGADVNDRDFQGQTAFMHAALAGEPEIVRLLVDGIALPASLKKLHEEKTTYLSKLPKELLEMTAQYITSKANPNIQDNDGRNALNFAIRALEMIVAYPRMYKNFDQLIKRYEEVINILEPVTTKVKS